jgi:hypothetical protein
MQADRAAAAFVELCETHLPGKGGLFKSAVRVFPGPPAGDQPLDQAVWIESDESEYDWRALGLHPGNRDERIALEVVINAYRERSTQAAAQAAAREAAAAIERAIEEHVLGDTCDHGGVVTDARVAKSSRTYVGAPEGWARRTTLTIVANHHPG